MYEVRSSEQVDEQVAHLPADALAAFAEARAVLEVAPWSGPSISDTAPDAAVRFAWFGPDAQRAVFYLVQERDRLVDLLDVFWVG